MNKIPTLLCLALALSPAAAHANLSPVSQPADNPVFVVPADMHLVAVTPAQAEVLVQPGTVLNPATASKLDLWHIGQPFGREDQWQFGVDRTFTAGACWQREDVNGQWLVGPCRDVFILAKHGQSVAHAGVAVMYNAEHGNALYELRAGVNVGPFAKYCLNLAVRKIPYAERLAEIRAPKFLVYFGNITTVDYAWGLRLKHDPSVNGRQGRGAMFKMDIPLDDLAFIQRVLGF